MWWQKLNKAKKTADEDRSGAENDTNNEGHFDFERLLLELKERREDVRPSDVVLFPEPLRSALNFAVRIGHISLTDFAKMLNDMDMEKARQLAEVLVARNLFHISPAEGGRETVYETRLSAMTRPVMRPPNDIWKKLDE
jgi:hypothetical protein